MALTSVNSVLIVGCEPSGLLLALQLARHGISVRILDAAPKVDDSPRAAFYGPPATYELRRAGVLEDVRRLGFIVDKVCWRKPDGTLIAEVNGKNIPKDCPDRHTCLPQSQLSTTLLEHFLQTPNAAVHWNHEVTGLGQDGSKAWVEVRSPEGPTRFDADLIVGCDGANSRVKRLLFEEFPGRTWDEQIIATNVWCQTLDWEDSNSIIHPTNWFLAARLDRKGLWRVTYGDLPGLSKEEYIRRQPARFREIFPSHINTSSFRLMNLSPYRMHQRCAVKFRVGRFVLAADAAHVCNPFGGLGLTGGLVDIGGLTDCIVGIHQGMADHGILDKYSDIRRSIYHDIIDPISTENFTRLWTQDPETAAQIDPFLRLCDEASRNKELSIEMQMAANNIKHDFTQYYYSSKVEPMTA